MNNKIYGERLSPCEEKENYIPFGEEWEKEIMKMNKKFIVGLYRTAEMKQQNSKDALMKIAQCSDCGSETDTIIVMKRIASEALTPFNNHTVGSKIK